MQTIKTKISESIAAALLSLYEQEVPTYDIVSLFEYPPEPSLGDISMPCFRLAKALRKAPAQIAGDIAGAFENSFAEKACAVNGYLNIYLNSAAVARHIISSVYEKGGKYGSPMSGVGKTVVLDYSSPNVAKPFHIGHLGTTVIGHSLKLLHEFAGYKCFGVNHLGDWGTQFGKLIVAYRLWGDKKRIEEREIDELVDLYVKFHAEAEKDESLNDRARAEFTKLEAGDAENTALWKWFIEISIREYSKTYSQLDISFDSYAGESFYMDKMPEQIELLRQKELLKIDDGASVVDLSAWDMPPCLILKRDGSTIYHTRDIAAAVYRKRTYDFDKCIYVTSAGQCLHFAQLFKVLELMGYDWYGSLIHVPYGTVSLNGEKLATRTGNVILLKDLFAMAVDKVKAVMEEKNNSRPDKDAIAEAVGVGAVVYHYLSNNRMRDINFILEDALSLDGNTGPYAQYTYARCRSIIEKAGEISNTVPSFEGICNEEKELVKVISKFPERINEALTSYEPSIITRFIYELATAFNRFYQQCPIISADKENLKANRLALVKAAETVLKTALSLICLKAPEKI